MIRKITREDLGRVAEILVYNNRVNFYPIFQDPEYSFRYFTVFSVAGEFGSDEDFMEHTWVYEDDSGILKGFVFVKNEEIVKLYVDVFFQNEGIGHELITYAIKEHGASRLWCIEKNEKGLRFYARHGFIPSGEKKLEEDTTEYLLLLIRADSSNYDAGFS